MDIEVKKPPIKRVRGGVIGRFVGNTIVRLVDAWEEHRRKAAQDISGLVLTPPRFDWARHTDAPVSPEEWDRAREALKLFPEPEPGAPQG